MGDLGVRFLCLFHGTRLIVRPASVAATVCIPEEARAFSPVVTRESNLKSPGPLQRARVDSAIHWFRCDRRGDVVRRLPTLGACDVPIVDGCRRKSRRLPPGHTLCSNGARLRGVRRDTFPRRICSQPAASGERPGAARRPQEERFPFRHARQDRQQVHF
jgi:hypothetical protein